MWSWLAPSGSQHIDTRKISSWYERRRTTGFPAYVARRKVPGVGQRVRYWNLYDALAWYLTWEPKPLPKGPPPGNQNARKHGRYSKQSPGGIVEQS